MSVSLVVYREDEVSDSGIQAVWETSILVWAPKPWHPKNSFEILFSVVFQQKICGSSCQLFHNASSYFKMASSTNMQTEKKNNDIKKEIEVTEKTVNESVFIHLTT